MSMPMPPPFEREEALDPPRPRKVTPSQLLDIRESEWRPLLESVSLVSEAPVEPEQLEQAAVALGRVLSNQLAQQRNPRLDRWPACLAVATVGIATAHYSSGTFWPALWEHSRVEPGSQERSWWGDAFLNSLDKLGLDTFPDTHQRYVGPIVMHAGVPTYCLGDLFDLILHRAHADPGLDAHGLHEWALGGQFRLNSLDVPARRFLSSGRDYALETIERCMHLLELLQEDSGATCQDAGLLDRFHQPAVEALERARARGTLPRWGRSSPSRRRALRPALRLDPYLHGVYVRLPLDEYGDDVRWEVATDEETHSVWARRQWGSDEQTVFTLPRPARTVSVTPHGTQTWQHLPLVDPEDPLLLFTEDGELVSADLALPPGSVWVLYPDSRTLERSAEVTVIETGDAPYGWQGWELMCLRLERSGWIGLDGGRRHHAQGRSRPEVELSGAVAGITTPQGAPVHSDRPTVLLPGDTGTSVRWNVEVLSADTGRPLVQVSGRGGERVRPFDELPFPVVGSFTVRVRGPLGRGVQRQVTVVEGLNASHSPRVRALASQGLVPGRSEISAPAGVGIEPARHEFAPDQTSQQVTVTAGVRVLSLSLTPPHMRVLTTGGLIPRWSAEPLRLDTEAVAKSGDLMVRLPEGEDPELLGEVCVRHGTEFLQWLRPRAEGSGNTLRFPLVQAAGTATDHGSVDLVVGYAARVVPLAVIRPRRLATGARHTDGRIHLEEFTEGQEVQAAVYSLQTPWRPPEVLSVSTGGQVTLPPDELLRGELRLMLSVDDPWSGTDWPRWPTDGSPNVLACSVPGPSRGVDAEEEALCRAFREGVPETAIRESRANTARLWRVLSMADPLRASGLPEGLVTACREALSAHPAASLTAHPDADPSPQESVRALVSTGLVAVPLTGAPDPAASAKLWQRLPVAACLAGGHVLALADLEEPAEEHTDFLERMEARCGRNAVEILRTGVDPEAGTGRFDQSSEHMSQMQKEQFDTVWRAARVVPRALLDGDSRAKATLDLFVARESAHVRAARRRGGEILHEVLFGVSRLDTIHREAANALVRSRCTASSVNSWRDLPAVSLALAVTARLSARGIERFQSLAQAQREIWEGLARCAPDLVATDIVLAELTLSGAERTLSREEQQ